MNIIVLSILYFTLASSAKVEIPALVNYRQRIEEMRRLLNKPKFASKTKRYKCIEIDDNNSHANNPLWSIGEASSTQSQLLLQMGHNDGGDSTSSHIMPIQFTSLNQKSINTPTRQPVIIELPRRLSAMAQKGSGSDLDRSQIDTTVNMPQARTISQVPHMQPSQQSSIQLLTKVENMQQSSGKPSLILSSQHCAQIKHYANLYAINDVKKWINRNCAFAKFYLPNATCEEINTLVASCNL